MGAGVSAGHFGVGEAAGCSSRLQNEDGEGRGKCQEVLQPPWGLLRLRLHLSGEGEGRPRPNSKAPPLNPSPWPREGRYHSMACPVVFLPFPCHPASPLPLPAPSAAQIVQGLEGPGWTPGPQADQRPFELDIVLPYRYFFIGFFFFFFGTLCLPIFFFPVLAKRGTVSCQLTDSPCPLAAATGDTGLSE